MTSPGGKGKGKGKGKGYANTTMQDARQVAKHDAQEPQENTSHDEDKAKMQGGTPSVGSKRLRSEVLTVALMSEHEPASSLLKICGNLWEKEMEFVVDTGATLEGCLSEDMVPTNQKIDRECVSIVRVGDGRTVWSIGRVHGKVDFGGVHMNINFDVLPTTAFKALLGISFLTKPEVSALSFQPPFLTLKNTKVPLMSYGGAHNALLTLFEGKVRENTFKALAAEVRDGHQGEEGSDEVLQEVQEAQKA